MLLFMERDPRSHEREQHKAPEQGTDGGEGKYTKLGKLLTWP